MIGKPQWFTYRIFGIMPRTWQGWAYILVSMSFAGLIGLW
jgi:hypothetical protein